MKSKVLVTIFILIFIPCTMQFVYSQTARKISKQRIGKRADPIPKQPAQQREITESFEEFCSLAQKKCQRIPQYTMLTPRRLFTAEAAYLIRLSVLGLLSLSLR
ncbi:hypothetical protein P5673_024783 [Acropora cervicornis]|uniref:Uncharacterized protein n=1 Tax=Acropora cervicornis TaxID=6130 RepID=A0AAD9UXS4_ACRCE|nr:hypothetical protein P5673_024783 [Acropora cervicornis]